MAEEGQAMTLLERLYEKGLDFLVEEDQPLKTIYPGTPTDRQHRWIEEHEQEITIDLLWSYIRSLKHGNEHLIERLVRAENRNAELTERLAKADHETKRWMLMWATADLANTPQPSLSDDLLQKAIGLCHPDRHDGSKVANEVTAALIRLRREMREQP